MLLFCYVMYCIVIYIYIYRERERDAYILPPLPRAAALHHQDLPLQREFERRPPICTLRVCIHIYIYVHIRIYIYIYAELLLVLRLSLLITLLLLLLLFVVVVVVVVVIVSCHSALLYPTPLRPIFVPIFWISEGFYSSSNLIVRG